MSGQLQTTVKRAYTTGFAGQMVRTGPMRGKVARILSASVGTDPAASTNRMSRVFGYSADESLVGSTLAADLDGVVVGGANFYGILGHPQHHVLYGTNGDALSPSMDLAQGMEAEFFDMFTGMACEVFNPGGATQAVTPGDTLAYVPVGISGANNPDSIPLGGLVWVAKGGAAPTGMLLVPGTPKIITSGSIAASGVGAPASTLVVVQL